jgi:hypothetical protein
MASIARTLTVSDVAREEVEGLLSNLDNTLADILAHGGNVALRLNKKLTFNYWSQAICLRSKRDYLKFEPYQQVWDELEKRGYKPRIATVPENQCVGYFGPIDMCITVPCIAFSEPSK